MNLIDLTEGSEQRKRRPPTCEESMRGRGGGRGRRNGAYAEKRLSTSDRPLHLQRNSVHKRNAGYMIPADAVVVEAVRDIRPSVPFEALTATANRSRTAEQVQHGIYLTFDSSDLSSLKSMAPQPSTSTTDNKVKSWQLAENTSLVRPPWLKRNRRTAIQMAIAAMNQANEENARLVENSINQMRQIMTESLRQINNQVVQAPEETAADVLQNPNQSQPANVKNNANYKENPFEQNENVPAESTKDPVNLPLIEPVARKRGHWYYDKDEHLWDPNMFLI